MGPANYEHLSQLGDRILCKAMVGFLSDFPVAYLDRKPQDFARLRCIERVIQELEDAFLGTLQPRYLKITL